VLAGADAVSALLPPPVTCSTTRLITLRARAATLGPLRAATAPAAAPAIAPAAVRARSPAFVGRLLAALRAAWLRAEDLLLLPFDDFEEPRETLFFEALLFDAVARRALLAPPLDDFDPPREDFDPPPLDDFEAFDDFDPPPLGRFAEDFDGEAFFVEDEDFADDFLADDFFAGNFAEDFFADDFAAAFLVLLLLPADFFAPPLAPPLFELFFEPFLLAAIWVSPIQKVSGEPYLFRSRECAAKMQPGLRVAQKRM